MGDHISRSRLGGVKSLRKRRKSRGGIAGAGKSSLPHIMAAYAGGLAATGDEARAIDEGDSSDFN